QGDAERVEIAPDQRPACAAFEAELDSSRGEGARRSAMERTIEAEHQCQRFVILRARLNAGQTRVVMKLDGVRAGLIAQHIECALDLRFNPAPEVRSGAKNRNYRHGVRLSSSS